jgi:tetratricopeptide (TPR) repeat protein
MLLMRGESQQLGEVYTKLTNATQLDPNFAKAYAALFEFGVRERVNTTHEELRQLADKLWELDREMAATHVARSFMEFFDWHYDEAVKECKKAIELNSHYEFAYSHLGMMLTLSGNPNEAQEHLLKALQLEDSKAVIYGMLGCVEFERRNFANAISKNKQALSFKQQYPAAYAWIGRSYQAMTNYLEAINAFQQAEILRGANTNECKALFKELRSAYVDRGERGYWNTLLERTNRKPGIDFYGKAVIYAHLGDTNRALDYLVESYNSREKEDGKFHMVDYLLLDEYWEGLHENPRFKALIRKLGYPNQ